MVLVRTRPTTVNRSSTWPSASLMRDMESFFRDFRTDFGTLREQRAYPAVNLTQDVEHFYLRAELPGMNTEEFDLSVDQNKITIRGSRDIPTEGEGVSFHRRERASGSFARTISLPADIDPDSVEAAYRDGVLTIVVPKAPEAKPRQITVQSS